MPKPWIYTLDKHWIFAVNATKEPMEITPDGTMGWKVDPFHAGIWFNGWAAGSFSPYGGWIAAGTAANEDNFIASLDAEIKRVREFQKVPA